MSSSLPVLQLHVTGMDCADCARTLERSVGQLPGVQDVHVNFTAGTLEATGNINPQAVAARVSSLGYGIVEASRRDASTRRDVSARGGVFALARYFLQNRHTLVALMSTGLLALSVPVNFLIHAAWARSVVTALHVMIVLLAGLPIASKGMRALVFARQITIDLLMSIATLGAFLIGETGEAATVIVLFTIGEALEGFTAERARDSLRALLALRPEQATLLRPCIDCAEHIGREYPPGALYPPGILDLTGRPYTGGPCPFCGTHEIAVPVDEVKVGEHALVRPSERIPVDGRVVSGRSGVNQAPVTGESLPVAKAPGDIVFAGTINGEAALEIEVTCPAADSTISRIVRLVEQAQSQRAPVERSVDRFASWYTPAVVGMAALLAFIPPLLFGQPFFDTNGTRGWLYRALAMLIVACPCALVISTPVTVVSALTGLARRGVLVKGGQFLDVLARVKTFAFDKTGTLTEGMPAVQQTYTLSCMPDTSHCEACDDMLALAATVERRSGHPLAQAVLAEAEARHLEHIYPSAEAVQSLAGRGVTGIANGIDVLVGSHTLFHERNGDCGDLHEQIVAAEAQGQTVMLIGKNNTVLGFVGVADVPRRDSAEALMALKRVDPHLRVIMLTGDNLTVAKRIATDLGTIDEVRAELLPEDKVEVVRSLQTRYGPVAMVGDGVNDAPALATAAVGIAMGGAGTAQAMETADMVLMQDNLTHLPEAVRTSRKALGIVRQNITFSLIVKGLFLLLTLPGWATLWMAVFADMGASLLVTANGMRARR